MRLKLLLTMTLFLYAGLAQAVVTVCASGCDNTTILGAQQTATATPNSIIQINDNSITDEGVTISSNAVTQIRGANKGITWGKTSAGDLCTITNGLTGPFSLDSLTLTKSSANTGYVINWTSLGVLSSVSLTNLNITQNFDLAAIICGVVLTTENQLTLSNCYIFNPGAVATGAGCLEIASLIISANVINARECVFKGTTGANHARGFKNATSVHTSSIATFQYCDFINCALAYRSTAVGTITDCIFSGNDTDQTLTSPATTSDFSYCARTNSIASPGTGSITITAARTFCDINNYYISPASLTLNAGISVTGVTGVDLGLNGILQGNSNILGMGCMAYSPSMCGGYVSGK